MQGQSTAGSHQSFAARNAARIRAPWAQPELVGKNSAYVGAAAIGALAFGQANVYIGPSLYQSFARHMPHGIIVW